MEKMKRHSHTTADAHGGFYTAFIGSRFYAGSRQIQEQFFGILLIFACHGPAATRPRSSRPPKKTHRTTTTTTTQRGNSFDAVYVREKRFHLQKDVNKIISILGGGVPRRLNCREMKYQRQQENVCISPITSIVSLRSFFSLFPLQSSKNKKNKKGEKRENEMEDACRTKSRPDDTLECMTPMM